MLNNNCAFVFIYKLFVIFCMFLEDGVWSEGVVHREKPVCNKQSGGG